MKFFNKIKSTAKKKSGDLSQNLIKETVNAYVFFLLTFYPLYFQNKYYNIGNAKWYFFLYLTFGAGAFITFFILLFFIERFLKHKTKCSMKISDLIKNIPISTTDWFVLSYAIVVIISTLFSPYKNQVIWGADGWYMGFIAQISFVLIYYFVSRYWKWDSYAILFYLGTSFIVFLLAILMRFRIDPLKMYQDLDEQYIINFLTTIGQATWYSSYMVLMLPLGIFAFWHYDKKFPRALGGIFTVAAFMTLVSQNSDSAFIALGILLFTLFWFSLETNKKFKHFLEIMTLCFASFQFIGICQQLFPENAVPLGSISIFCSQSTLISVLLMISAIIYISFCYLQKHKNIDISKVKILRMVMLIFFLVGFLCIVIYICLNTSGKLPENMKSNSNYLFFNEYWGNNRGSSWAIAIKSFLKGNLMRKIFGCGPDGFFPYVQNFFGEEIAKKWGQSTTLTCAHNEWLNTLVTLGLAGAVSYMGIFVSALFHFFKWSKKCPELIAIAISTLCYMGHNFFCYQQIVCTPIVFILIGTGESIIRSKEKQLNDYKQLVADSFSKD